MQPDESALSHCTLCPRRCAVDRTAGQTGFCGAGAQVKLARAALHFWEEPCISGERGSGAVFFSHCTLRCVYCQNAEISHEGRGAEVSADRLGSIFLSLQQNGAHNLNLVTPTHYAPQIAQAILDARRKGLRIPVVYNCGGYESVETIRALAGFVDVWLPDFKYFDGRYAARFSGAPDYPQTALCAIRQMLLQAGPPVFDAEGMLVSGVLVRHLALPGLLHDSMQALRLLVGEFGDDIVLSIMSQYTPMPRCEGLGLLSRPVNRRHYDALVDYAASLGAARCYVQNLESASAGFIPPFDETGVR